ncbi:MAG: DUF4097 family beta strand repeat-containing protein [bacterium]
MRALYRRIIDHMFLLAFPIASLMLAGCDVGNLVDNGDASGNATAAEAFSFELQVAQQDRIELRGVNGNVELAGVSEAQTVHIWGERRVTSRSTADAHAYLSHLQARVTDGNAAVLVETVQPDDNHGRQLQVDYHLRVPYSWHAEIHNTNGNVTIDSLGQAVAIFLINGNVLAQKIASSVSASSTNGNAMLNEIHGSAHVALMNGNVDATIFMPPRAACNLNTINGTIALQIPRATSAEFSASLSNGTIGLIDLMLQSVDSSPTSTRGRLGDGSGRISLKTVNGDIRVRGF